MQRFGSGILLLLAFIDFIVVFTDYSFFVSGSVQYY